MFGIGTELKTGGFRCFQNGLQIIREKDNRNIVDEAIWHFLLEPKDGTLKPSKYTSFNSRWRGHFTRSFSKAYRETRCLIPASGFIEGMNKQYHYLKNSDDTAILFGGLFKEWETEQAVITSASMITISPHQKLKGVHEKAMPLILPSDDKRLLEMWLDSSLTDTQAFEPYMEPIIRKELVATPIAKYGVITPLVDGKMIESD